MSLKVRQPMENKASYAMKLETLKELRESGQFHHATYRCKNTLWEGLWIYVKEADGFRGYGPAGFFPVGDPELDAAFEAVRGTGISVGAYGQG
jgi:hypothetical protein